MSRLVPNIAFLADWRWLRLIALLGFGLALGACSKCDVPDWLHTSTPMGPHACHGAAPL